MFTQSEVTEIRISKIKWSSVLLDVLLEIPNNALNMRKT